MHEPMRSYYVAFQLLFYLHRRMLSNVHLTDHVNVVIFCSSSCYNTAPVALNLHIQPLIAALLTKIYRRVDIMPIRFWKRS